MPRESSVRKRQKGWSLQNQQLRAFTQQRCPPPPPIPQPRTRANKKTKKQKNKRTHTPRWYPTVGADLRREHLKLDEWLLGACSLVGVRHLGRAVHVDQVSLCGALQETQGYRNGGCGESVPELQGLRERGRGRIDATFYEYDTPIVSFLCPEHHNTCGPPQVVYKLFSPKEGRF